MSDQELTRLKNKLESEIKTILEPCNKQPDRNCELYQFTDASGLMGIIESRSIHSTSFRFVNDRSEGEYGFLILNEVLSELPNNSIEEHEQGLFNLLKHLSRTHQGPIEYFISCFSEKNDHHGQWMEYGDRGRGFALGFNAYDLSTCLSMRANSQIKPKLLKVIYDHKLQRKIILDLIERMREFLKKEKKGASISNLINICMDIVTIEIYYLCIAMKDPRFEDEQEWRLCTIGDYSMEETINFRHGQFGLTPYIELVHPQSNNNKPSPLPIKSILPGPFTDANSTERSLNFLLRKHSQWDIRVCDKSNLPARSL
jgi:hypothetical protein